MRETLIDPRERAGERSLLAGFAVLFSVLCTLLAGIGEWRTLNDQIGALPKLFSLGVIACAVLCFMIKPDYEAAKKSLSFLPVFFILLLVPLLTSFVTWVTGLETFGSVARGMEKLVFQGVTILYSVSMVYMFGEKAVDWFFLGVACANLAIILIEIRNYGLAESAASVMRGLMSGGEAEGFMRALELHDFAFLYGQFAVYYLMFAPGKTPKERKRRALHVAACLFFLLLAFKRLVFPAVIMAVVLAFILGKLKKIRPWLAALGVLCVIGSYVYVYLIYSGRLVPLMQQLGINMMGRDTFWTNAGRYYEFSVFWRGLGFEAVDTLVNSWVESGLINRPYPLHNDYLKVFVELGSLGLALWGGIQYIFYPQYWASRHSARCAVLYFSLLAYMSVTYMTDNTAFYFWNSIGLRMIPMAFSFRKTVSGETATSWQPPEPEQLAAAVNEIEENGRDGQRQ